MNVIAKAKEYRLSQWAQIMQERRESGLKVYEFCEQRGINKHAYYYWLRRLRETACEGLVKSQSNIKFETSHKFTEIKLLDSPTTTTESNTAQLSIEVSGIRLTAGNEYPVENIVVLLRELVRPC